MILYYLNSTSVRSTYTIRTRIRKLTFAVYHSLTGAEYRSRALVSLGHYHIFNASWYSVLHRKMQNIAQWNNCINLRLLHEQLQKASTWKCLWETRQPSFSQNWNSSLKNTSDYSSLSIWYDQLGFSHYILKCKKSIFLLKSKCEQGFKTKENQTAI